VLLSTGLSRSPTRVPCQAILLISQTYEESELRLAEGLDGSGFRFLLYEDRFAEAFSARVRNLGPADGDLIPGTRRVVRGRNSQRLGDIDGSLYRAVRRLREIDAEAIRTLHGAEAESGAEEFFAISCTNARIGKQVRKAVIEENHGFSRSIIEDLYPRVVADVWAEEYEAIARLDFAFVPSEVRPLVARRCAEVARTTETNARPNDARPETLWTEK